MKYLRAYLLLLAFVFVGSIGLKAQLIISPEVKIANSDQVQLLVTVKGDQWIGLCTELNDNTLVFKARGVEQPMQYQLNELSYLGLAAGTYTPTTQLKMQEYAGRPVDFSNYEMPTNQLLYSATALPYLNRGSYRNTMVLINEVNIKAGKHFSFSVSGIVPVFVSVRAQTHFSASDFFHLGGAIQHHIPVFDWNHATHAYAIATLGNRHAYLNFTAGYWVEGYNYRYSGGEGGQVSPTLSLGGAYRINENWRIMVEGFIYFDRDDYNDLALPTFQFSYFRRKGMFDFGVVAIPDPYIPVLPVISYTRLL